MHKTLIAATAATSFIAISASNTQAATRGEPPTQTAASANPINGTWKTDITSIQFDAKPDELLLQQGNYSCKSCAPAYSVAADGTFHPVNLPYADSDAVKVVDDHTIIETTKKGDREVLVSTMSISADGKTLTGRFTDKSTPGTPAKGEWTETRVGPAPAGAHVVSGKWMMAKVSNLNDAALTVTVNVSGDTYKASSPDGTSFEAKIGDGDVPIKGDIAGTMVSVTKLGTNNYQLSRKRNGKVVNVFTLTLGADGRVHGVNEDKLTGMTTRWTADKQ